jgi:N-methylhydantoinase A
VYDRYKLFPNATFQGPAIIEEKESTVIVGEDGLVSTDDYGFLWIDISSAEISPSSGRSQEGQASRIVSASVSNKKDSSFKNLGSVRIKSKRWS